MNEKLNIVLILIADDNYLCARFEELLPGHLSVAIEVQFLRRFNNKRSIQTFISAAEWPSNRVNYFYLCRRKDVYIHKNGSAYTLTLGCYVKKMSRLISIRRM